MKTRKVSRCYRSRASTKANLNLEPIGPGAATQKYKVTDGTTGVVTKKRGCTCIRNGFLLKEKLEAKGIQVLMTRTSQDVDISNKERATFANNHKANLFYVFMQMVLKIQTKVDSLY